MFLVDLGRVDPEIFPLITFNPLRPKIVESSKAERLATGFEFTEGPLWHPEGHLLFVNNRINRIYRLEPGGEPEVIRENSGAANGLTFDLQGRQTSKSP